MARDKNPEPTLLITRRELARLLGVTERHCQKLDATGLFRPVKLGTSVRYLRAEVEATLRRLADEGQR